MKISDRLKALRKQHSLKLREISKQTDLSISYISDIERGRTMPSLETCGKLAAYYGMTISKFLEGVKI